ncbi:MAG: hypothetical protein NC541_15160 [bacterium]|nr:hypothetical protein [bacterium]
MRIVLKRREGVVPEVESRKASCIGVENGREAVLKQETENVKSKSGIRSLRLDGKD